MTAWYLSSEQRFSAHQGPSLALTQPQSSPNAGELGFGRGGQVLVPACRGGYGNGGPVGRVVDQDKPVAGDLRCLFSLPLVRLS